jgi:hypothetical protein
VPKCREGGTPAESLPGDEAILIEVVGRLRRRRIPQPPTALVPSERADRLFAYVPILGKPRDKRMPKVMPAVIHLDGRTHTLPRLFPSAYRLRLR